MNRTPEQRRRARPFLCRHNLWHSWELRKVDLFGVGQRFLWVCRRCRTAHSAPRPYVPARLAEGGIVKGNPLKIIGDHGSESVIPLSRREKS